MSITSEAAKSKFVWLENGDLSVEGAVIMYRNFEGRPTQFNAKGGKRTFNVVLSEPVANELKELGWNIREKAPRDVDEDWLYTTEIVINTESKFPPKVFLCSDRNGHKRMSQLEPETLKILDTGEFSNIDLIIHPYQHARDAKYQYKGYLKTLYAMQSENVDFAGKYANYLQTNDPGSPPDDPDDDGNLPF